MKFEKAIAELESRGIMPETAPDLKRMKQALEAVGYFTWPFYKNNHDKAQRTIIVAGTNGKGTTSAALATLLTAAGERVGFYSSPHLENYTERIRIGLSPVTENDFALAHEKIVQLTQAFALTHFEILTLMAAFIFCSGELSEPCDRLVFEVGLGGLWDATNALPHDFAVITRLGLDHENLLGKGLYNIAVNKLGVAPAKGTVVHVAFEPAAIPALDETKASTQCRWVTPADFALETIVGRPPEFTLESKWGRCRLPLPGQRAAENVNLALSAFAELGFEPEKYLSSLEAMKWPGRMELRGYTKNQTPVYLSGDHNPQGIASLVDLLKAFGRNKIFLIVGIGKDKSRDEMLTLLDQIPKSELYLTTTPFRGAKVSDYGEWGRRCRTFEEPEKALAAAITAAEKDDLIVVSGSLYLVGQLRPWTF